MPESIIFEENNAIATLTLNRPEKHNAFDDKLIKTLLQHLKKIEQDKTTHAVILKGAGKHFSAGADLAWMQRMIQYTEAENIADAKQLAELMDTLYHLSKPTIALVQGAAYGGGVGLAACCDIAIGTSKAAFCLSEVKIGMTPAVISPYVINVIGERAARRYFLTAEVISAEKALALNLISEIVSESELQTAGLKLAETLLANSPKAVTGTKDLITRTARGPIDHRMTEDTAEMISEMRVSKEGQEGLKAFLEKRTPNWQKHQ
ncbi:MAG: enoyl-CoA hydratase/isomerase family protein [Proteobacteria bacterium]|nr:enoyl-CoA hydratase/isomerase family protein [Pseudomonadota bacterium]